MADRLADGPGDPRLLVSMAWVIFCCFERGLAYQLDYSEQNTAEQWDITSITMFASGHSPLLALMKQVSMLRDALLERPTWQGTEGSSWSTASEEPRQQPC